MPDARPAAPLDRTFLGLRISRLNQRRWRNFRRNNRGFWSLWIFLVLFGVTLFAELIANDKPLLLKFDGDYYVPVLRTYPETAFGGVFETEADYRDPAVQKLIREKNGWAVWPLIPFSYRTVNYDLVTTFVS